MEDAFRSIILAQTGILFANLEETLNSIEENSLHDNNICDWPLGEQIYHLLHSMDQWYINPNEYEEPGIIVKHSELIKGLSKSELIEYFNLVKAKITGYIESLSTASLIDEPPDCQFTRLALILGQFRHFMYHIGLIHGCLRVYTKGESPAFIGLGMPIKPLNK